MGNELAIIEPLTSPDCDLRDFPHMQLDVVRLRDSDLAAVLDAEVFRAAVLSWCVAWHQVPAASLPDDDAALCRLLGYGRDVKSWQRVRAAGALRGYILCSDGRLYHPVVAEKATDAWQKKRAQRDRTEAARQARWSQRQQQPLPPAPQPLSHDPPANVTENVTQSKGEGEGEERRGEEKSTSLRSEPSARDRLFAEGLPAVRELTGKNRDASARLIVSWVKSVGNDEQRVLDVIRDAAAHRPVEPVSWIVSALKRRSNGHGHVGDNALRLDDPHGLLAWIAKQDTDEKDGEYPPKSGKRVRCIKGYAIEAAAELIADTIAQAGGSLVQRPNWDALAGWCRDDLMDHPIVLETISRVTRNLDGPVRSLAVFDLAIREQCSGRAA